MSSPLHAQRRGLVHALLAHARRRLGRNGSRRNRGTRRLGLEALEHRQLLSVSPLMPPASGLHGETAPPAAPSGDDVGAITSSYELVQVEFLEQPGTASSPQPDNATSSEPAASPANASPVAADDAFSMRSNQQLGAGVLVNDSDPDGDPLTVVLENNVAQGTLVLASDGLFTYKPNEGFAGTDRFTYVASDGLADSNPATVTISVAAVNDTPRAENDTYTSQQNQPLLVAAGSGVLANDTDTQGDPLTATPVDGPSHGTLTLHADGSFEYTPEADFLGQDTFTYRASDAQSESNLATVSILVRPPNEAPQALDDGYSTGEDQPLSVAAAGVLANDTDADADQLTAVLQSAPKHGTLTLGMDGSFEYTPNADFHGSDGFTYLANDGQADGNLAAVTITVEPVNDLPVAADDGYTVNEDQTLLVDAAGVLTNDADVDGDPLAAVLVDGPANGVVTLAADGSFEYTPNADFHGSDSFTYLANDGQADGNLATVTITVEPVNDLPVAADDGYTVNEDETLLVDAAGVLTNDADVDGDLLAAVLVDGPANGVVTLAADGSFEYTPNADFHGSDGFTYVANDGQADGNLATVSITVREVELAISLAISGTAFGPDAGAAWAGSTFWVSAYVQDLRDIPQGVVGGAIDLLFDSRLVTPTGAVAYGEDFTAFQQGTPDDPAGLIDEAGALTTASGVGADGLAPFAAWQFARDVGANGAMPHARAPFAVDPGEGTATITPAHFALVGSGEPVDWALVAMGTAEVDLFLADFNGDELINHFDLALWQPHSGAAPGDPSYDPTYDLSADSRINQPDLDLLMSALYQPAAPLPALPEAVTAGNLPGGDDLPDDALADRLTSTQPGDDDLGSSDKLQAVDELLAADLLWS